MISVAAIFLSSAHETEISVAAMLLTLGLLLYVFAPVRAEAAEDKTRVAYLLERKDAVYENLRDLNFEHKAGKFSRSRL